MDLRLSKALGTNPGTWYTMQANYDMWQAKRRLKAKVRPITKAAPRLSLDIPAGNSKPADARFNTRLNDDAEHKRHSS
jgi:hypothetical protein